MRATTKRIWNPAREWKEYRELGMNKRAIRTLVRLEKKIIWARAVMDEESKRGEKRDISRHASALGALIRCGHAHMTVWHREFLRRYAREERVRKEKAALAKTGAEREHLVK